MLQAHHINSDYTIYFHANEEVSEVVPSIYKQLNGWEREEDSNDLVGYPLEEILEIIDRFRIPLEGKKFDGIELTNIEETYLVMLELLTDKILDSLASIPEESSEVKSALQHAKRIVLQKS